MKLVIIGLDGATWELLDKLVENHTLPNLKKIIELGVSGNLKSSVPPITAPAWVSFATGRNPGKHGCYDFLLPYKSLTKTKPISSINIKSKTFYEYLDEIRKKTILINLPVSTPPKINNIVVADFLTKDNNLIYPLSLEDEIMEIKNYRLAPKGNLMIDKKVNELVDDILKIEEIRFDVAKKLFGMKWDLFFVLFSGTDWIQHQIYDTLLSDTKHYGIRVYEKIDSYIGWFMKNLPEDASLIIISDHGFKKYEKTFFINEWLKNERYLLLNPKSSSEIYSHRLQKEYFAERNKRSIIKIPIFLAKFLNYFSFAIPLYFRLKKILPLEIDISEVEPLPEKTLAYSSTTSSSNFGGIYINTYPRFADGVIKSRDEYEKLRNEIIEKLNSLRDSDGNPIFEFVLKKEEIYKGNFLHAAPDILLKSTRYVIDSSFKLLRNITRKEHSQNGIFVAYGNYIATRKKINAEIIDLASTILHIFGIPIPRDMDGRVLKEIFREDSELAKRPVVYQDVGETEKQKLRQKIKSLKMSRKI